jgi:uncharacterized protein YdhG (YjbR/CyaY superfamily)
MEAAKAVPATVDAYMAGLPDEVRAILEEIRRTVRDAAPQAEEGIKYGMPSYQLHGSLVYFSAFKKHIGFFCTTTGNGALEAEVAPYAGPKGNLQFPLGKPVPMDLIRRIVEFRVQENLAAAEAGPKKPKK